ncbi:Activating signal cointegrator 1 complex subunit 1 [Sergentomyia squamirostris]
MDVLSPDLVWIENRCYRVNPTTDDSSEYQSDPCYIEPDFDSEEEVQMDFAIEKTKEGSFRTSFHVPSCFHGSIIGQKGATRKRLEMDTKCLIQVPSRGSKQPIVVTAQREEDAIAARKKIEDIVFSSRRRQDITHFPSLPCCQDSVVESFAKFKNSILSGSPRQD